MIAFHLETLTAAQFCYEYSDIMLYEKKAKEEPICEELMVLLESSKVIRHSKFIISLN
jgi:hypothetical protein